MGMAMKFDYEAAVTRRLFDVVALPFADLANPMAKYGRETGADVEVRVGGRIVGIQVTDFSGDEGAADPRRGLRARESRNVAGVLRPKRRPRLPGSQVPPAQSPEGHGRAAPGTASRMNAGPGTDSGEDRKILWP